MTREDCRKILGEEATEEQITNMLNNFHIQESAKVKELEKQLNGLKEENSRHSDYDDIKKQLDDINRANMTEQEKLEQMRKEAEQMRKEAEKELISSRITNNTAKAKEILAGITLDDDIIQSLVSDNLDVTIAKATKMRDFVNSTKEVVAKETKESLTSLNLDPTLPNVNQNEANDVIDTFEKFGKLSAEEQNKWISEHPNEFENLS